MKCQTLSQVTILITLYLCHLMPSQLIQVWLRGKSNHVHTILFSERYLVTRFENRCAAIDEARLVPRKLACSRAIQIDLAHTI